MPAGGEVLGRDIVTVAVKEAYGRLAAKLVPMAEAGRMIKAGVKEALGKAGRNKPFKLTAPCTFELAYHVSAQADMGAMLLPQVKRLDARTLAFTSTTILRASAR